MKTHLAIAIVITIVANSLIGWGIKDNFDTEERLDGLKGQIKVINAINPDLYFNNKLVSTTC